tara:strand:- start:22 stop:195 length:174 start_codon:yes stop_codon:yes gene_type:complete
MNITNARYIRTSASTENDSISVTIDGKSMSVPLNPDNRHYQAILEWVAEGNKIEDAD